MLNEPLTPAEAEKLIKAIAKNGEVKFSTHAVEEMGKDKLTVVDVVNVLRAGYIDPADPMELFGQSWRYRMRTRTIAAPTRILSETVALVVTAWRYKS